MANIRVEFLRLGEGGKPLNVIAGVLSDGVAGLSVTTTATDPANRPVVPDDNHEFGVAVRLIATGGNVMVAWGPDPTATSWWHGGRTLRQLRKTRCASWPDCLKWFTCSPAS